MEKINEILSTVTVKTTVIAMALNILYLYLVNNILLSYKEIIIAILTVGLIGYLLSKQVDQYHELSNFFVGFIAYFAYEGAKLFFKITEILPDLKDTATAALIFGAITVVVLWVYKRY